MTASPCLGESGRSEQCDLTVYYRGELIHDYLLWSFAYQAGKARAEFFSVTQDRETGAVSPVLSLLRRFPSHIPAYGAFQAFTPSPILWRQASDLHPTSPTGSSGFAAVNAAAAYVGGLILPVAVCCLPSLIAYVDQIVAQWIDEPSLVIIDICADDQPVATIPDCLS